MKKSTGCSLHLAVMLGQLIMIMVMVGLRYRDLMAASRRQAGSMGSQAALRLRRQTSATPQQDIVSGEAELVEKFSLLNPECTLELDKLPGHGPPAQVDFCVAAAFNERGRRDAIRNGWGKLAKEMGMRVRFFVGTAAEEDIHGRSAREAEQKKFGDLVILNMTDGYASLTLKTLAMLVYAAKCGNGQYIGKVDEDVFVWTARLSKRLSHLDADTSLPSLRSKLGVYLGNFWLEMKAIKDPGNKNHEGRYMGETFPPYAAGPVYFMSRPVAEHLYKNAESLNTAWHNEDMALGTWLIGADVAYLNEWHLKILGWKHHERPFIAEHCTDTAPWNSVEEWQLGLATNFSTRESQFETPSDQK